MSADRRYGERLSAEGAWSRHSRAKTGQPPGNLFVIIHSAADPRFERHGRDLYRVEIIEVVDAVLGATIDLPTPDSPISIKIPRATQPDSMLRLRGKGLPQFGGGGRGDLYVRVQIHIQRLTEQRRRLFEQLRESSTRKHVPP